MDTIAHRYAEYLDRESKSAATEVKAHAMRQAGAKLRELDSENEQLRGTMVELLEILRQWEPDHSSGEDRQKIVRAMYQTGILTDPTTTLRNMTEAANAAGGRYARSDR